MARVQKKTRDADLQGKATNRLLQLAQVAFTPVQHHSHLLLYTQSTVVFVLA